MASRKHYGFSRESILARNINSTEKHPFIYVLTTRFKLRLIRQLLNREKKERVLDIGCGSGFILSQMEDEINEANGIDVSEEAISFGRKYTNVELTVADAENLPFQESTFDSVISTDAFEHIPNDLAAMREVKRVLKPGGCFVVYVPCECGILSNTPFAHLYHTSEESYLVDRRYYTLRSLAKKIKKAGFQIEFAGYHDVFIQELFTQALKWLGALFRKRYVSQADITVFISSSYFPFYRGAILPVIDVLVHFEELICEKLFRARIPGHRIVMKCRNIDS